MMLPPLLGVGEQVWGPEYDYIFDASEGSKIVWDKATGSPMIVRTSPVVRAKKVAKRKRLLPTARLVQLARAKMVAKRKLLLPTARLVQLARAKMIAKRKHPQPGARLLQLARNPAARVRPALARLVGSGVLERKVTPSGDEYYVQKAATAIVEMPGRADQVLGTDLVHVQPGPNFFHRKDLRKYARLVRGVGWVGFDFWFYNGEFVHKDDLYEHGLEIQYDDDRYPVGIRPIPSADENF